MFKCTHCGEIYGEVLPRGKVHNFVSLELKEDQVCPDCGDGVLRPIKCGCVCHAVFDKHGEPRLCETCALCNPEGWRIPSIYPVEDESDVRP